MDVVSSWAGPPSLQSPRHPAPSQLLLGCHLDLNRSFGLKDVFAPFQEPAVSSLFNNMEIYFGKENHDVPLKEAVP